MAGRFAEEARPSNHSNSKCRAIGPIGGHLLVSRGGSFWASAEAYRSNGTVGDPLVEWEVTTLPVVCASLSLHLRHGFLKKFV